MIHVYKFLSFSTRAMETLEQVLEETEFDETASLSVGGLVAILHKPKGPFKGLDIFATDDKVRMLVAWP